MAKDIQDEPYPGSQACASELLHFAEVYHQAAIELFENADRRTAISYAPARMCSLQSIELCLNAFLRTSGASAEDVRGRHHSLIDETFVQTLRLKKKTAAHLETLTEQREYLLTRYAPDLVSEQSELTRLRATLDEVMQKTKAYLTAELED